MLYYCGFILITAFFICIIKTSDDIQKRNAEDGNEPQI